MTLKESLMPRVFIWVIVATGLAPSALRAASCESLAKLSTPAVSITLAKTVEAGSLTTLGSAETLPALPAFCRVAATLKPTADSVIGTEIWLPQSGWNGKLLVAGSGGWGGAIGYGAMADALLRGYATVATDDGHQGGGAAFIVGHPEKLIDFAYRAEHEMTVEAKALVKAFYGRDARYTYWNGCSGGGREGLLQAARYPKEYDGVIAGDAANVRRNAWALWLAVQTFKDPAARIPAEKYPMIHQAVLNACDAQDGLKDGLLSEPERCTVDFKALACTGADAPSCLTTRQVQSAQTLVSPATTANGEILFPRLEPGTELRWSRLAGGPAPGELFLDQFRYLVYPDTDWDWRTFDLERDAARAHAVNKEVLELDPRLAAFEERGGKLLMYHGWADQQVAPGSSVEFYKSVVSQSASPVDAPKWVRLFMVPGMGHCSGGEGPDDFDALAAMERWVEHGDAPAQIVASHRSAGRIDRTRPLCPYPQVARYKGQGSIDEAANFSCQ
ncbi:MAG: tannase/feruloyl esterase family alpha/beta hydrolase [Gammaproteobacteria bacterium]